MTGRIFLNYRRTDSAGYAGRLYDRLAAHFGGDAVFMDVSTIDAGVDFVEVLQEAVHSCDVLITVIGPQWLKLQDEQGNRRLDNPEDFVRIELAAALERDIRVIPALVGGTVMPRSDQLPDDLKALARRNAFEINHQTFHTDTERLIQQLETALAEAERKKAERQETLSEERSRAEVQRQIEDLLAQAGMASEAEEWVLAEEKLAKVLGLDAGNRDAKARLEIVRRKIEAQAEKEEPAPPEEKPEPVGILSQKAILESEQEDDGSPRSLKWILGIVGVVVFAGIILGVIFARDSGRQIAFHSDRSGNFDIWRINTSGDKLKQLTDNLANDMIPAWSPDGNRIAFASDRSGNWDIWLMDADGGRLQQLTDDPANDYDPAWSPDGSQIVFSSTRSENWDIWLMDVNGDGLRQLTDDPADEWHPAWSSDGMLLAYIYDSSGNFDIWVMEVNGDGKLQLTVDPADDYDPVWSPKERQIAFVSYRTGEHQLWMMDVPKSGLIQLTEGESTNGTYPAWSPDGDWFAFVTNSDIWLMDVDGGSLVQLTDDDASDGNPTWQP